MMSNKLYRTLRYFVLILGFASFLVLSTIVSNSLIRLVTAAVLFTILYIIYTYLKLLEYGFITDEREQRYSLEALRYSLVIISLTYFAIAIIYSLDYIDSRFYLGFSTAYLILVTSHLVIYKILIWLK